MKNEVIASTVSEPVITKEQMEKGNKCGREIFLVFFINKFID